MNTAEEKSIYGNTENYKSYAEARLNNSAISDDDKKLILSYVRERTVSGKFDLNRQYKYITYLRTMAERRDIADALPIKHKANVLFTYDSERRELKAGCDKLTIVCGCTVWKIGNNGQGISGHEQPRLGESGDARIWPRKTLSAIGYARV